MEEKKNIQNMEELSDEQLEQASGGCTECILRAVVKFPKCKNQVNVCFDPVTYVGSCPICGKSMVGHFFI